MILHLGVLDVAYSDASGEAKTTGDVAEGLERGFDDAHTGGYHIMETFFELRREKIAGYLADSMANSLQVLINGGPPIDQTSTLTFEADQKIETEFRTFLDANEMSRLLQAFTGAPISAAAAAGVSHRRKNPYAKRDARPAFIDTGLYRSSFRSWVTTGVEAPEAPRELTPA